MITRHVPKKNGTIHITRRNILKKFVVADHRCIMTEKTCGIPEIPEDIINYIISFIPKCKECETYGFEYERGTICVECQYKNLNIHI